jgi:hypothetical protein
MRDKGKVLNMQTIKTGGRVPTKGLIAYGERKVAEIKRVTGRTPKQLLRVVNQMKKEYAKEHNIKLK